MKDPHVERLAARVVAEAELTILEALLQKVTDEERASAERLTSLDRIDAALPMIEQLAHLHPNAESMSSLLEAADMTAHDLGLTSEDVAYMEGEMAEGAAS